MNAKHLSKFSISKKLALLGAIIAVAIIATFFISSENKANASDIQSNVEYPTGTLKGSGGTYSVLSRTQDTEEYNFVSNEDYGEDGGKVFDYYEPPSIDDMSIYQTYDADDNDVSLVFTFIGGAISFHSDTNDNTAKWTSLDFGPIPSDSGSAIPIPTNKNYTFYAPGFSAGVGISGHVTDANDVWQAVPGAFVQYCQWNPWFWDYVPVPEMSTFTDWFGNYTIEGVTKEMLPGVIRVYRFGYEVGESEPIGFVPDGIDTIYRFIQMAPSEPPVPPTPPTPPDPPVPPVPPQPDPPQPVPPIPVPTPVDPGTIVPQTSDSASYAFAIFAMMAMLSAGILAGRKLYVK